MHQNKVDYFAVDAVSNSRLGVFSKSPMHYRFYLDHPELWPESPAFIFGSAAHTCLLEPDKFYDRFYVLDLDERPFPDNNMNKRENKLWRDTIRAENEGLKEVTSDEYEAMEYMMAQLQRNELVQDLLKGAELEIEHYWQNDLGFQCKAKLDIHNADIVCDYKTTENASPWKFQKDAWSYGYHRQGAWYTDAVKAKEYWVIAQEKKAPYAVSVHKMTPDLLDHGRGTNWNLLQQLKQCEENNQWPGYEQDSIHGLYFDWDVPDWSFKELG